MRFLGFILSLLVLGGGGQVVNTIDVAKLPAEAATVEAFVPEGWVIEDRVEGDLNKDAVPDLAVKLVEKLAPTADKENPPERQRALLLLLKAADGHFRRAALAAKVLMCTRCGGAFYGVVESPSNVAIENGVLVIRHEYGSRELSEETLRFRYEAASGRFALIGQDLRTTDRLTGVLTTESTNFLTGLKLTSTQRADGKRSKSAADKRERVAVKKRFIEEVEAGGN